MRDPAAKAASAEEERKKKRRRESGARAAAAVQFLANTSIYLSLFLLRARTAGIYPHERLFALLSASPFTYPSRTLIPRPQAREDDLSPRHRTRYKSRPLAGISLYLPDASDSFAVALLVLPIFFSFFILLRPEMMTYVYYMYYV